MLPLMVATLLLSSASALSIRCPHGVADLSITRNGSSLYLDGKRWTASGANVYWLGLDENVIPPVGEPFYAPYKASYPTKGRITEVMTTLNVMGARTIRSQTMGVSVGNPLSVMPELGRVNEEAFESMDWTVYQARKYGIRIFAPFTDNYDYYHGGKFVFLRWRGIDIKNGLTGTRDPKVQEFYTNRTIIDDFKNYIKIMMTHRNPYTNLTYAEDPTIFAYETGNELGGPKFGDKDVPVAWTREITEYIKKLGPTKLAVDGTYGINSAHLNISSVDIFSDHFYPMDVNKLSKGVEAVGAVDKVYFAAEYGWTPQSQTISSIDQFFAWIEEQQKTSKPIIAGDHFWSLFMHNVPDCSAFVDHDDGFTLQYGNPKNPTNYTAQISKIQQHLFKMQGKTVGAAMPPAPCLGKSEDLVLGLGLECGIRGKREVV
ncbi:glycoside hydrolase superfamily [Clohesyomyces aquaticus]|uniref:mannan endo-1,4-beta-mannosidase n=1 Tax=Clohesyomyces aquaticus TaxID=1231657 RepID=A0A1Y1ZBU3_9PLEO|nr:glycoside hydrolase superfamily [Clohesyomyces aquaticus]